MKYKDAIRGRDWDIIVSESKLFLGKTHPGVFLPGSRSIVRGKALTFIFKGEKMGPISGMIFFFNSSVSNLD